MIRQPMRPHCRSSYAALTLLAAVGLAGCATPKAEVFRRSFLPPPPAAPAPAWIAEPPELSPPSLLEQEEPLILAGLRMDVPPRPTRYDSRLRRAEERFQAGKRLYLAGDRDGARRAFDEAVDLLLAGPESITGRLRLDKRFEDLIDEIYRYDIEGLGAGDGSQQAVFDKAPIDELIEMTFPIDPKLKNKLFEQLAATTSQLPLTVNDEVLRYVNYFSSERGRRVLLYGLRRAGRYKPMIQRILDEEGVPQELIYLAQAESGFMPRAVSRRKATGMWQFVQFRGREYGLNQTPYVDDRLDPEKSTRAAARHLRDLYQQMGDWYLALAAYNCGPNCVDRAVQRTGYADFWELRARNVLPLETANYVPIILAMTIMGKNLKEYGIEELDADPPLEYETIQLPTNTNLDLLAAAVDRPVSEIRELNPALLKNIAPAGYDIHLPKGTAAVALAALDLVPPEKRETWRLHRAQPGDTVALLARRYGATQAAITAANGPRLSEPEPGDLVVIPAAPKPAVVARKAPVKKAVSAGKPQAPAARGASASKKTAAPASGKKQASKNAPYRTASIPGKKTTLAR